MINLLYCSRCSSEWKSHARFSANSQSYCSSVWGQRTNRAFNCFLLFVIFVLLYNVKIQFTSDFFNNIFFFFFLEVLCSTFVFCTVRAKPFCMFHPVWPDGGVVPLSSPRIRQAPMRWAQVIKGVHICILAYLWFPLRRVDECCIANRKV